MPSPAEKLADALDALKQLQADGSAAIRSKDISRSHRELLMRQGFLREVMKGWYIATNPGDAAGDSTPWYTAFWPFCASYLNRRFDDDWCLSPEQSLLLHAGNWTVPKQLLVRALHPSNNITQLPHGTSLFDIRAELPDEADQTTKDSLRSYTIPAALIACSPKVFQQHPVELRAVLSMIRDGSDLLERLLDGGHTSIAGRLAGACRNIGRDELADTILETMKAVGYRVIENDPFETPTPLIFSKREISPYVSRIQLLWHQMREDVIESFPKPPGKKPNKKKYLSAIEDIYSSDAYNSLSIEGYHVSPELIDRVKSGNWDPENHNIDRDHRNALAARGYWQAFQVVKDSIEKILDGDNPGEIAQKDHGTWYRELFAPSVTAGILRPRDLAGYRNGPVYIRQSMHVPPNRDAVRDLMPAFFDLLANESDPSVRVVLGHFVFVYIHPYVDGNGRIGRFLMNAMLASGGYNWTVIPVEKRQPYMAALESASVDLDITPFCTFLAELVTSRRP